MITFYLVCLEVYLFFISFIPNSKGKRKPHIIFLIFVGRQGCWRKWTNESQLAQFMNIIFCLVFFIIMNASLSYDCSSRLFSNAQKQTLICTRENTVGGEGGDKRKHYKYEQLFWDRFLLRFHPPPPKEKYKEHFFCIHFCNIKRFLINRIQCSANSWAHFGREQWKSGRCIILLLHDTDGQMNSSNSSVWMAMNNMDKKKKKMVEKC